MCCSAQIVAATTQTPAIKVLILTFVQLRTQLASASRARPLRSMDDDGARDSRA